MRKARRCYLRIEYDGITIDLQKYFLSFSYTDNSGEADEITITLQDRDGEWSGPFWPQVRSVPSETSTGEQFSAAFSFDDGEG